MVEKRIPSSNMKYVHLGANMLKKEYACYGCVCPKQAGTILLQLRCVWGYFNVKSAKARFTLRVQKRSPQFPNAILHFVL